MAKAGRYVIWNDKELLLEVEGASLELIDKIALQVIAASKPPVDTGYLDASAYVNSSSGLNTFDLTWQPGQYVSRHGVGLVDRDSVDSPETPPKNGAVVGWAAVHSVWIEEETDFIYEALTHVAAKNR